MASEELFKTIEEVRLLNLVVHTKRKKYTDRYCSKIGDPAGTTTMVGCSLQQSQAGGGEYEGRSTKM